MTYLLLSQNSESSNTKDHLPPYCNNSVIYDSDSVILDIENAADAINADADRTDTSDDINAAADRTDADAINAAADYTDAINAAADYTDAAADINATDDIILNINKPIIYPNQKIYTVAPIIEQNIIDRDNYQPSTCLINCQNCIRMLLDCATNIYIYLEYIIKIFTILLVHIDIFNITKSKLKIIGRSKFNKFIIEDASTEKLRRIVYWFYYNNITPDEDQWREVLTKFKLNEVPSFTMRLYNNNIKSVYSITLENMVLQTYEDNVVIKGTRTISLYEDIIDSTIEGDIYIKYGKKKISTVSSKIPVGGLMPEKFISDLNLNKILNKIN